MKLRFARRADFLVATIILLIAFFALLLLFYPKDIGDTVTVYYRGEKIDTFLLGEPYSDEEITYSFDEGSITLCIGADGVSVVRSDCASQTCVKTGSILRWGEAIICLPLRFSVIVDGEAEFDGVTG